MDNFRLGDIVKASGAIYGKSYGAGMVIELTYYPSERVKVIYPSSVATFEIQTYIPESVYKVDVSYGELQQIKDTKALYQAIGQEIKTV
jgi:hypothetical protein